MHTGTQRFPCELREAQLRGDTLTGYAAVFNVAARVRGGLEMIAEGAFTRALATDDPRYLLNHDPSLLLGRKSSGTLRVVQDSRGLDFEVDLPMTQAGRDVRELVERGDLDGGSFGFTPGDWEYRMTRAAAGQRPERVQVHTAARRLLDLSIVTYPAYEGTTVALRSDDLVTIDNRTRLIRARHHHHTKGT